MKTIQKVYLSGLGAIGSAYASRLFEMDPECIKVIVNEERVQRYNANRITVNGKVYPFHFVQPQQGTEPADLILLAVKQHHLTQAIQDIKNFVGSDTIILSLLNGISSEEVIGNVYGMDKILHAFCVGTDATREGTHTRFANIGRIVFGDQSGSTGSAKVAAVQELFDKANIPYNIPENIIREQWWKFMMNVGINQTSAVLKAPYGVFQKISDAQELMKMASREVVLLSEKLDISLNENDINKYIEIIKSISPEGKTSMLQDIEAGRKTEVEIFAGTVIELGRKYGVDTPVNAMLYKMIRTLEQM